MKSKTKQIQLVFVSCIAIVLVFYGLSSSRTVVEEVDQLNIYYPFVFKEGLDPLNIYSVGDQVLSEHLFSFHARTSMSTGFENLSSDVIIDNNDNSITIHPRYDLKNASGENIDFQMICDSILKSLKGTRHAPYASIMLKSDCNLQENKIKIFFKRIPINLRFLLTLPDFSIVDLSQIPLKISSTKKASTGPYYLDSISNNNAVLKMNPYYPKNLRANEINSVNLNSYQASDSQILLEKINTKTHHAVYFFGFSLKKENLNKLESKGYKVQIYPTEWFTYLITKDSLEKEEKNNLVNLVNNIKKSAIMKDSLGIPAYSISPSDREFSLKPEPNQLLSEKMVSKSNKPIKIATLSSWASNPFFKDVLVKINEYYPNMQLVLVEPREMPKLFTDEMEVVLAPLGISPTDPLTHFSFLESILPSISKLIAPKEIADASIIDDPQLFNQTIQKMEYKIIESQIIIPIAHFPGVVAHRKDFNISEKHSFGWGIQSWAIQVNSHQ